LGEKLRYYLTHIVRFAANLVPDSHWAAIPVRQKFVLGPGAVEEAVLVVHDVDRLDMDHQESGIVEDADIPVRVDEDQGQLHGVSIAERGSFTAPSLGSWSRGPSTGDE
jgi:hypothetical protein